MRAVLILVLVAGCAAPAVPLPVVPPCGDPVPVPIPPARAHRSVETIAAWGNRTSDALLTANRRISACAATADSMRAWINRQRQK